MAYRPATRSGRLLWRKMHAIRYSWWFGLALLCACARAPAPVPVDTTPAVGSIASRITGRSGHVAYVTAVHPDGSFDVNEANFVKPHTFGSRTNLRVGSDFHYFLHFEK